MTMNTDRAMTKLCDYHTESSGWDTCSEGQECIYQDHHKDDPPCPECGKPMEPGWHGEWLCIDRGCSFYP